MIIENGLVFRDTGQFEKDTIYIENGRIAETAQGERLDAAGLYIVPGLIDIHLHGCAGFDVCDGTPEVLKGMAEFQLQNGITAFCPATMALPLPELEGVLENVRKTEYTGGAAILGINLEGTFLAPGKAGAQKKENLCPPDLALFQKLQESAGGKIRLLTIAPELPGAMEFIGGIKETVRIALGHTGADYDIAASAFQRGVSHVTHLFNAMEPMGHRRPGVPGAALDAEHVMVELIGDGEHIHPAMVKAVFKMFGEDRIILISDSMRACGMPEGEYTLGGQQVQVKGKKALLADGTIAGSVCHLMDMVRSVVQMGIPLGSAVKCASYNPAKALGVLAERGSLSAGSVADMVLLDKDLNIRYIIQEGRVTTCE
ncbi:MAG: N-acetylglucosamine-6-phosphate deacetylase [Lachnospiraceae bacterium]|nr:N-acetylglucosamine-6-phosphate deacetylase [Lachnospiraceae bacterium]